MKSRLTSLIFLGIVAILILALSACGETEVVYPEQVDWQTAVEILNEGQVAEVMQSHNLQVVLTLDNGRQIKTIEPEIDAIFREVERCGRVCDDIILATE